MECSSCCSSGPTFSCQACAQPLCADLTCRSLHRQGGTCSLWRATKRDGVGRLLVASRDIRPWEAVIQDKALVVAPGDLPLCIFCLADLGAEGSAEVAKCKACGWPICPACNELTDGPGGGKHVESRNGADEEEEDDKEVRSGSGWGEAAHREECLLFQEQGVRPTLLEGGQRHWLYPALGVIRMLLLRKEYDSWRRVDGLMDHWEEWTQMPQVVEASLRLGNFIQKRLGLVCTQGEVEHCWGVLQTNSISVGATGRALFPLVSLLSHSCLPCLEPAVSPSAQSGITLRARRAIKAGEELTMPYTDVLREVRARQENLQKEWHFSCTCPRCSDPSEGGSFFSSLRCSCGGFAIRQEEGDAWKCSLCASDLPEMFSQEAMVSELGRLLESTSTAENINQLVDQLDKVDGLHDNHWLRLRSNIRFCDLMMATTTSEEEIARKVAEKSEAALATLSLVDPGLSKLAGRLLVAGSTAEQRLLLLRARRGELEGGQKALAEVVKKRTRGMAMLSSFCITGKAEAKG